jgi:hypothetical protein
MFFSSFNRNNQQKGIAMNTSIKAIVPGIVCKDPEGRMQAPKTATSGYLRDGRKISPVVLIEGLWLTPANAFLADKILGRQPRAT